MLPGLLGLHIMWILTIIQMNPAIIMNTQLVKMLPPVDLLAETLLQ